MNPWNARAGEPGIFIAQKLVKINLLQRPAPHRITRNHRRCTVVRPAATHGGTG
nr:MAG TPA: hypothetical protein [Caudoviricetes sp.]